MLHTPDPSRMKRSLFATVLVLVAAGAGGVGPALGQEPVDCSFPVTAPDATGETVTVPEEPERVVVLAPSAAQTVWAIGAREKVVGMPVNQYTAYLADREGVRNVVTDQGQPIQEAVVELDPDLVLAPNIVANDTVRSLRDAGPRTYKFRPARSLADVSAKTELTGLLVGEFPSAARTSAETRGTVAAVREAVADEDPPRVYYYLGGRWTAGNGTFIDDVIGTAGGENVAVRAGVEGYGEVSGEVIVDEDPEFVVVQEGSDVPSDAALQNTTALRQGNVVRVDANFVNQPGPRNVVVLRTLAAAFHPVAYDAADVASAPVPERTRCEQPSPTATTEPVGDGGGATATDGATGPGLTAWQAALALAAIGALALRRR